MPESDWANKGRKCDAGVGALSKVIEAQAVWGWEREMDRPVLTQSRPTL